jgi:hypothetical protein
VFLQVNWLLNVAGQFSNLHIQLFLILLSRHEHLDVGSTNANGQHIHKSTIYFLERGALGCDHAQEFVPGFYK